MAHRVGQSAAGAAATPGISPWTVPFSGVYRVLPGFFFYRVSNGTSWSEWDLTRFDWVLLGFTGFTPGFHRVGNGTSPRNGLDRFLPSGTGFWIGFGAVLANLIWVYWVLPDFALVVIGSRRL